MTKLANVVRKKLSNRHEQMKASKVIVRPCAENDLIHIFK